MPYIVNGEKFEAEFDPHGNVTALTYNFMGVATIFQVSGHLWADFELGPIAAKIESIQHALDIDEKAEYWEPPAQLEPRDDPAY